MKHIDKTSEVPSLTTLRRSNPQSWQTIHDAANQHVYDDCLKQIMLDQENLCGYTEMRLDQGMVHIDHFVKRDIDPRLTFCWENMIAAIKDSRYGADWKDRHITHNDYDRANHRYNTILNPIVDDFHNRFKFATDGTIEPYNSQDIKAARTINVFNLNEDSLRSRRRDAMEAARAMIAGGMTKQEVYDYLSADGFVSAVDYEIRFA